MSFGIPVCSLMPLLRVSSRRRVTCSQIMLISALLPALLFWIRAIDGVMQGDWRLDNTAKRQNSNELAANSCGSIPKHAVRYVLKSSKK